MTPQRIRVSVLADDPVTLCGLTMQLRAGRGLEVVAFRNEELPEVVVVGAGSLDAEQLRRVRAVQYGGRTRVVVVAGELDTASLLDGVEAGASVILRRRETTDERLAEGVRLASTGERALPSDLLSRLMRRPHDGEPDGAGGGRDLPSGDAEAPGGSARTGLPGSRQRGALTVRELTVLRMLADGCSTAEIATELAYSESTIKSAIHEMTSRLDLRNRSHAVAYAVRAGLI